MPGDQHSTVVGESSSKDDQTSAPPSSPRLVKVTTPQLAVDMVVDEPMQVDVI